MNDILERIYGQELVEAKEAAWAEGLAEGKAEGLAEGKAVAKKEVVLFMYSNGCDADSISKMTAIPVEDIKRWIVEV